MLKYTFDIGMNWCLFHEDENCMECTADKCIHARKRRCEQIDNSDECYICGDDVCLADE